jgi:folate-dependent phosphoribosylglycinamide formyltransferase PurN
MPVRLLIISGPHPRHRFALKPLTELGVQSLVIQMTRENMIPTPSKNLTKIDTENFVKHFGERAVAEDYYFGNAELSNRSDVEFWETGLQDINSAEIVSKVINFNPTIAIIFGCGLLRERILEVLPEHTINLHLGLSPDYKGSATLFWPFYMLEPQFAGFTIHKIVKKIDAGGIYSQGTPRLELGDGIHDVGCKTVLEAQKEMKRLVEHLLQGNQIETADQKRSGKLWLVSDFHAHHLRLIYNNYKNLIVDAQLNGELSNKQPKLHVGF